MFRSLCVLSLFVLSAHAILPIQPPLPFVKTIAQNIESSASQCFSLHSVVLQPNSYNWEDYVRPVQCLIQCALNLIGLTDEKGNLNGNHVLQVIPSSLPAGAKTEVEAVIKACSNLSEKDSCVGAFKLLICLGHQPILKTGIHDAVEKATLLYQILFA